MEEIISKYKDQNGFVKETDVRFNKGPNCYVIVESVSYGKKTKIAYHIAR